MKQRLFIASSVEGLEVAYAAQENLEYAFEVTVWPQGVFELTKSALESLCATVSKFDAAVFVFTADDVTEMRGVRRNTVRDNVLFELGLFIGRLDREKCFIVLPRGEKEISLPSDLIGITPATYDGGREDGNLVAALGPACNKIKKALNRGLPPVPKKVTESTSLHEFLTSRAFRLVYEPSRNWSKVVLFGQDGFILEGNNQNEHKWAIVRGKVEIYNLAGKVFSRFEFNSQNQRLIHTNEPDTLSIKGQYIVPEKGA